jgi:hypothetical protein
MALYQPNYCQPNNVAIDSTVSNNFVCQIQGTICVAYKITILKNSDNSSVYAPSKVTLGSPLYNGDFLTIVVPNISGMVAGTDYKWKIDLYWDSTNYVTSLEYLFKARSAPSASITNIANPVTTNSYTFTGSYTQAQSVALKYFRFKLYDENQELLDDSGEQYSADIQYTFRGFIDSQDYYVQLTIENQDGTTTNSSLESFTADYPSPSFYTSINTEVLTDEDAVKISWSDAIQINGTIEQEYLVNGGNYNLSGFSDFGDLDNGSSSTSSFDETIDGGGSNIPSATYSSNFIYSGNYGVDVPNGYGVYYSNYTQQGVTNPLNIDDNFTLQSAFQLYNGFNGKLVELYNSNTDDKYILSFDGTKFTYRINSNSYDYTPSTPVANNVYWKVVLLPDTIYFYKITDNGGGSFSYNKQKNTIVSPSIASYNKVKICSGVFDYLWIKNEVMTESDVDATALYDFVPTWTGYALMVANYDNTLAAGTIASALNINSWTLYRQKQGDTIAKFIANIPLDKLEVKDYTVSNKTSYKYVLYPETTDETGEPIEGDYFTTDWWNWSLTEMVPSATPNIYSAGDIYLFDLDISSSDIPNITDVYQFETFGKFDKINQGIRNYEQGTLSCLIGYIDCATNSYIDTVELKNNLRTFINNSNKKLLKDRKGNCWVVKTKSLRGKYRVETIEQATDISFDWVQIQDLDDVTVILQS